MHAFFDDSVGGIQNAVRHFSANREAKLGGASIRTYKGIVEGTLNNILADCDLTSSLLNRSSADQFLLEHTLKVSILSVQVAATMGLKKSDVVNIGLCSVLQDLGMLRLPDGLVHKMTPLTPGDLAELRRHPTYSATILAEADGIPAEVCQAVAQSHERLDGSGYPGGVSGDRISPAARILCVVDQYVAMTSARPYRPPMNSYDVTYTLLQQAHHGAIDRDVVRALLQSLSLFPIGTLVELSSGEIAKVISTNERAYTRPVVAVLYDSEGNRMPRRHLDLLESGTVEVSRIVEPSDFPDVDFLDGFF